MNNDLKIKPLIEYELSWADYEGEPTHSDKFTADGYVQDENSLIFYRTGNVIRQYFHPFPSRMIMTPADVEA